MYSFTLPILQLFYKNTMKTMISSHKKMIKPEQKELSDFVKQVHLSLRRKSRQMGAENAWKEHLQNEDVLRKYAFCMRKLAEDYWSVNNASNSDSIQCRIEWIINSIVEYFQKGGIHREVQKEEKKMFLFVKRDLIPPEELALYDDFQVDCMSKFPYKLLDVGSCYNPFGKFEMFHAYPIDLYPASSQVKKCNFLETVVKDLETGNWFHDDLTEIPLNFFQTVVFSLFLEYLPSPKQRYDSCKRAYDCLKTNGLLFIITPDSKHASANASIMKSWKIAAAHIGFVRIKLEKLKYLHCMVFRKSISPKYPLLLNNIKLGDYKPEELIIIPQDLVDYQLEEESVEKTQEDEEDLKELFTKLPFC